MTYNSKKDNDAFICMTPKGTINFKHCPTTSFPYIDLDNQANDAAIIMVQTIHKNFYGYTHSKIERAIAAWKAHAHAGHSSKKIYN